MTYLDRKMVRKEIDKLKKTKSPGPDDIFSEGSWTIRANAFSSEHPSERTLFRANAFSSEYLFRFDVNMVLPGIQAVISEQLSRT